MRLRHSTEEDLHITWLSIDGLAVRAAIRTGAEPDKEPLLLFNGIGGSLEMLLPFADAYPQADIILFDVPGAGKSPAPSLPWRLSRYAHVAAKVLDEFDVCRANIMGISWGGALAQQFAKDHPGRCRKLILAATSPGHLMVPGRPEVLWHMSNPRRYYDKDFMKRIAGTIYGGKLRTNRLSAGKFADLTRPPSKRGYYYQILAGAGWSSLPWLHKIRIPTIILHGDDDPIIPLVNAKIMNRLLPNSRLRSFNCGHLFMLTRANRTAEVVRRFLREEDDAGQAA